jgi:hypothetical protein
MSSICQQVIGKNEQMNGTKMKMSEERVVASSPLLAAIQKASPKQPHT